MMYQRTEVGFAVHTHSFFISSCRIVSETRKTRGFFYGWMTANWNYKLKLIKVKRGKTMKYSKIKNNKITAISALKRGNSAPQLVVVAPSGSGKSTLIYLLLNHRLIPFMKIGIGEKSQTTIILTSVSKMRAALLSKL